MLLRETLLKCRGKSLIGINERFLHKWMLCTSIFVPEVTVLSQGSITGSLVQKLKKMLSKGPATTAAVTIQLAQCQYLMIFKLK